MCRPLYVLLFLLSYASVNFAAFPVAGPADDPLITMDLMLRGRYFADGRLHYERYRGVPMSTSVVAGQPLIHYGTSRGVLGVTVMPSAPFTGRLALQYEGVFGEERPGNAPQGTVFLREGWVEARNLFDAGLRVRAGRFPWMTGRGRVFGHNDWMYGGPNLYDGLLLDWPCLLMPDGGRWSLLGAQVNDFPVGHPLRRPQRVTFPDGYLESWFYSNELSHTLVVLAGDFLDGTVQPFISADFNVRQPENVTFLDADNLWHAGVYVGDSWDRVSFNVDAVYQFGMLAAEEIRTDEFGREIDTFKPSLNMWLLAADVGYGFEIPLQPRLTLGFDWNYGSWEYIDSGVGANNYENIPVLLLPFSSHHDFLGALDMDWSLAPRRTDLFGEIELTPFRRSSLRVAYHRFLINDERRDKNDERYDLGHEMDLELELQPLPWLGLEAGYAVFWRKMDILNWGRVPMSPVISPYDPLLNGDLQSALDRFWLQATFRW